MSKKKKEVEMNLKELMEHHGYTEGTHLAFTGSGKTLCTGELDGNQVLSYINRHETHPFQPVSVEQVTVERVPFSGFISLRLEGGETASMWHKEMMEAFTPSG